MREYPNVYVVVSYDDGVQAVFYNNTDAEQWIANSNVYEYPYEYYYIEGPFKVG